MGNNALLMSLEGHHHGGGAGQCAPRVPGESEKSEGRRDSVV